MKALLPKEHGAYGQLAFPVVTGVTLAGAQASSALVAVTVVAGFLLHEPLLIVLGHRGIRARREHGRAARAWLTTVAAVMLTAGLLAMRIVPPRQWWTLLVPAIPAALLFFAAAAGREKSAAAQVSAAVAFSLTVIPIGVPAGVPATASLVISSAFAVSFVLATLAVRVVILRVRAGGDRQASRRTARLVLVLATTTTVALSAAAGLADIPSLAVAAFVPGVVTATLIAWSPPPPARLRSLGWLLIATSALTSLLLIAAY
jgi:hypothetical protein